MAYFEFENKRIYYECYGDGKPLLILNGIMMSCASWKEFIEPLSAQNTLILFDMLDQGKSAKMTVPYNHSVQIRLTDALLKHLNIKKVCIAGISYGSEIGLEYAVIHPEKVERLMLFNAAAAQGPWLSDIGKAWNAASSDPMQYYYTTIPVIYSPGFYKRENDWMERRRAALKQVFGNRDFIEAMIRLTDSSLDYDVRNRLCEVRCPTLIVSCQQDHLTPVEEQMYLSEHIKDSHYLVIQNSGHASMYEQPLLFSSLILGFANNVKTTYQIK